MKKRRQDINGVIYASRFRVCYCMGGMIGRRNNKIWRSCFLEEKTKTTPKTLLETHAAKSKNTCLDFFFFQNKKNTGFSKSVFPC